MDTPLNGRRIGGGGRASDTGPAPTLPARDAATGTGGVTYSFPVEVEVRAVAEAMDPDEIVERALARLAQALESG